MTEVQEAPPLCECHGEPKIWHKYKNIPSGGRWRCRIKKRESAARWYVTHGESHRAHVRAFYHAPNGGYIKRRYKRLAEQRGQILDELGRLANAKSRLS